MKRISKNTASFFVPIVIATFASFAALTASAQDMTTASAIAATNENDSECFPMCKSATATETKAPKVTNTAPCGSPSADIVKQAEDLNERIKPIKEIVGYIRSPQGLAIKLVNDHVVKIPAWVGYAMNPVGSLKNRVMDEARTVVSVRVKAAIGPSHTDGACVVAPAVVDPNVPIDATAIPLDTNQI